MVSVVAYNPATRAFTAEEPPTGTAEPELSIEVLRLRVRQQELLADFGVLALKGTPFPQLLHEAAQIVADGLKAEFAKASGPITLARQASPPRQHIRLLFYGA
jgi:hypothetical protein